MLPVHPALSERSNSVRREQPMMFVAIFADAGPMDSVSSQLRMIGSLDPAQGADVNVRVSPETGELMLAPGTHFALDQTTTPLPAGPASEWRVLVTEYHHYNWWGKVIHDYYGYSVTVNDGPILLPFVAQGTCSVDAIRIQLGNVDSGGGTLCATTLSLRFIDVDNNKQVGNVTQLVLNAPDPLLTRSIAGFSAGLVKSRRYALEIAYSTPPHSSLGFMYAVLHPYYVRVVVGGFDVSAVPPTWSVPLLTGGGVQMAGMEGFMSSGAAWRTLDVCSRGDAPPTEYGVLGVSDVVPAQTSLTLHAWATHDAQLVAAPGVAGWDEVGEVRSGEGVPPYRYWRIRMMLTSTPARDDSPRVVSLALTYMKPPVVLGTHAQEVVIPDISNAYRSVAVKAVNAVSATSSSLEPRLKTVMVGQHTVELTPEPEVLGLFARPLRGKRVLLRAGYADTPESMLIADCVVRDIAYQGGRYLLTVLDPLELADVSVPRGRWPAWSALTDYVGGVTVTFANKSYLSLAPTVGQQPDLYPAVWQEVGSVWIDIVYPAGTHLCAVARDLLENQVNMASERIDLGSLDEVQARYPGRVTTGRVIANPEKALDILSDIAWLTESYWTMREGRLALLSEPAADAQAVVTVTPYDIKETLNYRRGWADLKNECLILTQYLGTGSGNEQYSNAIGVVDAQSVSDYGRVDVQEFKDKFNLPADELTVIASNFVERWKNGRRIVRVDARLALLPLQQGEVALLRSAQLPEGGMAEIKCIVMQKNLDWMGQSIQLTLMEI